MKEPKYVKLYGKALGEVKGITGMQFKVFYMMIARMDSDNMVVISRIERDEFLCFHGIVLQTFRNALSGLVKHGIVAKEGNCTYSISKKYARPGT